MEKLIEGLIGLIKRGGPSGGETVEVRVHTGEAPPCVRALVDAMASCTYSVDLGEFQVDPPHLIHSLASSIEVAQDGAGLDDLDGYLGSRGPGGAPFDPASTLELAADGGGMSALGIGWSNGRAFLALVEIDDPTEDNMVKVFATPAEFFAALDRINRDSPGADVEALRVAAGLATAAPAATAATPAPVLSAWTGPAPAHPFAEAQAHFAKRDMLLQAGPTPEGRLVLARRRMFTPPCSTQVVARTAAGATTELSWEGTADVASVSVVPGRERAVLCAGSSGPLVEIDLVSGARRELLASVGWSCGFVDADHLAVLDGQTVRVYRYGDGDLGEPVASAPAAVVNIFVGHGCVFGKSREVGVFSFQILRWTGGALVDTGSHAVDAKPFAFHAASAHGGTLLLGAVDTKGVVSWFAYSPV